MNFIIKDITEDDLEGLLLLIKEFAAYQNKLDKVNNSINDLRKDKNIFDGFIIKDETGELAAYLVYFNFYSTFSGRTLYLEDLYVREDYRNRGLGSRLIRKAIEVARNTNCKNVRWQVSSWNENAIKFYEDLGAEIDRVELNCNLPLE